MVGAKPGKKFYEEMTNNEEARRTVEIPEYFAILLTVKSLYHDIGYSYPGMSGVGVDEVYSSSTKKPMPKEKICNYVYGKKK